MPHKGTFKGYQATKTVKRRKIRSQVRSASGGQSSSVILPPSLRKLFKGEMFRKKRRKLRMKKGRHHV